MSVDEAAFRAEVDALLRRSLSERGARVWWRFKRVRLADLSPAELLDLGCYETIRLELFRVTGRRELITLRGEMPPESDQISGGHSRVVTDETRR